jgi:GT2 family glycosyltransferase
VSETVCAVVVTHNRLALLRECLGAVFGQTRSPDAVLVVDNASTDGTPAAVEHEFPAAELLRLPRNDGSSGGFHDGMAWAQERGFDWLWVMDDDTVPRSDALELLLTAPARMHDLPEPSLLASKILWTDGRLHPMNYPGINLSDMTDFVDGLEQGYMRLRHNTFPSLLIRRAAIDRHGLPKRHFFLWSDDIEFTQRILREEVGYLVPESVAEHRTKTAHHPHEGGPRFYYAVRNGLFILRGDSLGAREKLGWTLLIVDQTVRFLIYERARPSAWWILVRAVRDGLLRRAT